MKNKTRIGVLFGGRSGEHEVSLVSAESVMHALDKEKYDILPIGIRKDGRWICGRDAMAELKGTPHLRQWDECILAAEAGTGRLLAFTYDGVIREEYIDVFFPVLHGTYGEDGTIQGLFELAGIPYVGAGVLASSIGMDKVLQKEIHRAAGLPVVQFHSCWRSALSVEMDSIISRCESLLGYPVFVKPANLGSSVGISKATERDMLRASLELAARFDRKIIVEQAVPAAREFEVAVLGNANPRVSLPGEVIPSNEFYDYDAKYVDDASRTVIPADIPDELSQRIRTLALKAFLAIDCEGLARVDFLYARDSGELFLNEINTMPGFTSISMYPKMWEASGLAYPELLDELIALAFERHDEKRALEHSFTPKKDWYRSSSDA